MRIVLIGDGESAHLLKWARALAQVQGVQLWAASSRGFCAEFDAWVNPQQRLALGTHAAYEGGNVSVLLALPRLGAWLRHVDADWLHAHYLTSHGTLAWLAKRIWRLRGGLVGSAWGSDVLITPRRNAVYRGLTKRVLRACRLTTSDSAHMARQMRELGAAEVMTFPFGLDALPAPGAAKQPWLFFANRGLEPLYQPLRVMQVFAQVAQERPEARLVVANQGSLQDSLRQAAREMGLRVGTLQHDEQVEFTGVLDADAQARWYAKAQWYLSLPRSDSVSVSVLEAMAHGCIPLLSDLPANRELVCDGENGVIVPASQAAAPLAMLDALLGNAVQVARANRDWVATHALFPPAVARFVARLRELGSVGSS
ncbi:MAG: glycosyltransferase [Burkholderiaceae bacterium]